MELSKVIAALALALAGILVGGYSRAADKERARETVAQREAARQVALAEHQRRKETVVRLCSKPIMTQVELEACRAAYRRL